MIPHQDSAEINAQISVSAQNRGKRIGDQGDREQKDGSARRGEKAVSGHTLDSDPSDEQTSGDSQSQLEKQRQRNGYFPAGDHGKQKDRQHIGDRIVGSGFQFQQRVRMVFQSQLPGTEHIENGSGVCGRNYRADQKTFQPFQTKHKVDKSSDQTGGKDDAQGGKQERRNRHRARGFQVGSESSVKHNENETGRTDGFRKTVIIKRNMKDSIYTKTHAKKQEKNQGRNRDLFGDSVHQDADNGNDTCK